MSARAARSGPGTSGRPDGEEGSVLVTGAYGLLGSRLCAALLDAGHRVTALGRHRVPTSALCLEGTEDRLSVVIGDVRDSEVVGATIAQSEVDTVFHLAAQTIVGTANENPASTWDVNVRGTWTVLEACRLHGVGRVLVASSDKAYGPSQELPYRESHPLGGRYPYDASKAAADVIARSYWYAFGLPTAVTRFANVYGGGDLNPSRLIPAAVAACLEGRAPVIRSDGKASRDFLYVDDAVSAYLAIAAALAPGVRSDDQVNGACGGAFNAGGGRAHSALEVARMVCRLVGGGLEPEVRGHGTPHGELECQYVDAGRLRALTGWAPGVGLEEGLTETIAWYRRHPGILAT